MMMMMGQGQQPKGDIRPLWRLLGVQVPGSAGMAGAIAPDICWQEYNPYPILAETSEASSLWIFAREEAPGANDALSEKSEMTKGLKEVFMLYAGVIVPEEKSGLTFTPLIKTGTLAGTMTQSEINSVQQSGLSRATEYQIRRGEPKGEQILAALIEGPADSSNGDASARPLKTVYVTDIDCMSRTFIDIRNRPPMLEEINFQFQNITFVLNVIDVLAGEMRYPEVRRHIPTYSTLKLVELKADEARKEEAKQRTEFSNNFNKTIAELEEVNAKTERELKEQIEKLQTEGTNDPQKIEKVRQMAQIASIKRLQLTKKAQVEKERLQRERDQGIREARRKADDSIGKIQNYYKLLAVFVPPIPPLLVGIVVLVSRRLREREGISKNRLR
jgi:ABC-2 type transport system permease protein